jgi:hypothetical protein
MEYLCFIFCLGNGIYVKELVEHTDYIILFSGRFMFQIRCPRG